MKLVFLKQINIEEEDEIGVGADRLWVKREKGEIGIRCWWMGKEEE